MKISDLISVGWLGVRKDKNFNYKFFKDSNFQPFISKIQEVFLIFKSQKVRFVDADFHKNKNKFFIDIKDKYVREEIDTESSKVKVYIEKSLYQQMAMDFVLMKGIQVFYKGKQFGILQDFYKNNSYTLLSILVDDEELLIPYVDKYIDRKDTENNILFLKEIDELLGL